MPRPQIIVNVLAALARRGTATTTGTAFHVYAGAAGPAVPTRCFSEADALAAAVPAGQAAWVGDALRTGAPEVVVLRAAAVNAAAVTEVEWDTALAKLTDEFGLGQVYTPGVATAAAHAALVTHCEQSGRTILLDGASDDTASELTTAASGLAAAPGAIRGGYFNWGKVTATGGATRDVPGSVLAAGLAARGDAFAGHANNAPMADQGRKAGVVPNGVGVTTAFSLDELDDLADAGVSVFVMRNGELTLTDWRSFSDDERFTQLNIGRMTMEMKAGLSSGAYQFLGRQIDGKGHLFAELEGMQRGYLQGLWAKDALYGEKPEDAFDVDARSVNTPTTIAAGELHSAVEAALTPHTERIVFDVVTRIAEGA